jgi:hypothetical protein
MGSIGKSTSLVCAFVVTISLAACGTTLYEQNRAARQDQAASVHVAVLSVGPWEDYRDSLQPFFKMTPDDALAQAVPTTLALEEKFLNAFSARLKAAAPGTSFTETSILRSENGQVTTNKEDVTKTTTSGDASKVTFGDSPVGSRTASGLPPTASVLGTPLSVDPMLKYLYATALYQEVQLLNWYVKNSAIDERYAAYIVRLQVSLMPLMRDEPYDAYSTISFFSGPFEPSTGGGATYKMQGREYESLGEKTISAALSGDECKADASRNRIQIIPLLVTDDIEAAVHSRSLDELRQLALALSALIQGVGVGADIGSVDEKLRTVLGRDFNSKFNVARVSDNTLRCRFGALNQAQSRYGLIPQTHNVTLLVLVPSEKAKVHDVACRTVRLVAKTTLTDVEKGTDLPGRRLDEVGTAVKRVLEDHGISQPLEMDDIGRILYSVADNDYGWFCNLLKEIVNRKSGSGSEKSNRNPQSHSVTISYPESIWVDVVSIRNGSQYSSASFSVPQKQEPGFVDSPGKPQTPVLIDDGKSATIVKVRGGVGIEGDKLAATLTVLDSVTLTHTSVKVTGAGKEIEMTFPSLTSCKLNRDGKLEPKDIKLTLYSVQTGSVLLASNCRYLIAAESAKPQFSITTRCNIIEADKDSKGKITLVFSGKADKPGIFFAVKGADAEVEKVTGGPTAPQKDDGWTVSGYGTVRLNLSNLNPISPVTISGRDLRNGVSLPLIVLPVVKQAVTR